MAEQTYIPIDERPPPNAECAWCGKTAVDTLEVEKAKYAIRSGVRVMTKHAIVMPVCRYHQTHIRLNRE